jgi:hypothetical protein
MHGLEGMKVVPLVGGDTELFGEGFDEALDLDADALFADVVD